MIAVLLADGFEEIEALTPVDMLRRAGLDVRTVGITSKIAVGSHGISVVCDLSPEEVPLKEVSLAVFPGGMPGSLNLDASPFTDTLIEAVRSNGGRLAAICAAPLVLGRRGLLKGLKATCYPGFEKELAGAECVDAGVVTDGYITTAKGMGVSLAFAEELVALTAGKEKAEELSAAIMEEKPTVEEASSDELDISELLDLLEPDVEPEVKIAVEEKNDTAFFTTPGLDAEYSLCSDELLADYATDEVDEADLKKEIDAVKEAVTSFVPGTVFLGVEIGPRVMRLKLKPPKGKSVNSVTRWFDDIAIALCKEGLRMEAPIPGESAIALEVPLNKPSIVGLKKLLREMEESSEKSTLVPLGVSVDGTAAYGELSKMPHLLVSGATGMGKSVFINSVITSLILRNSPESVRFILIDPKRVEFSPFKALPHLVCPIVYEAKAAAAALAWANDEMERRYSTLAEARTMNIDSYNAKVAADPTAGQRMPRIVIVIDELSDLMMQARNPIEDLIMRLTQKARAAGIHLVIGTQRPFTDVVTGVIKANVPARVCFKVCSRTDSRTVLEQSGAEHLLNRGDMLITTPARVGAVRIQAPYVSDREVEAVTAAASALYPDGLYSERVLNELAAIADRISTASSVKSDAEDMITEDQCFLNALELAVSSGKISTSLLQRKLCIGYGKAARYIDAMEDLGVVSEPNGQKPREVLITEEELRDMLCRIGGDDE